MSKVTIILLIICVLLTIALIALYFYGKKMEAKQAESQAQMEAAAQQFSMLVIDKKRLRMKDSGLPQIVIDSTPRRMRFSKVPVVKAKVGPKIMTLMCDDQVFDAIPVKKEVKAKVSGIYIMSIKGIRGSIETPKKKKGLLRRLRDSI